MQRTLQRDQAVRGAIRRPGGEIGTGAAARTRRVYYYYYYRNGGELNLSGN